MHDRFTDDPPEPSDSDTGVHVTIRELAVLGLMADGLIAVAIAHRLGISPRTVSRHMESIYRKLGAHDRTTAVLRGQALGLLSARSRAAVQPEPNAALS